MWSDSVDSRNREGSELILREIFANAKSAISNGKWEVRIEIQIEEPPTSVQITKKLYRDEMEPGRRDILTGSTCGKEIPATEHRSVELMQSRREIKGWGGYKST